MYDLYERRELLKAGSGALLAGAAGWLPRADVASAEPARGGADASFRFAFLTDIHVRPELRSPAGFRQCVAAVNSLSPAVDFVITGGDLVFDVLAADLGRAESLWDLYEEIYRQLDVPVHHVIGNHDIVGWSPKSPVSLDHPAMGKRMFIDRVGHGTTYRSFDHKGWHFILLDSMAQTADGRGYFGVIDDEQVRWLEEDLTTVGRQRPVVVVTHIPFFSVWRQMQYGPQAVAPHADRFYVKNADKIRRLLAPYNVKLVLQGHMHVCEEMAVSNVAYITTGAVCGNQWKGPRFGEFPEGFGVVTIRENQFQYGYQTYGWKADSNT